MTNYVNETIKDFTEDLLNRIMYDFGWEHHIFFSLEGASEPKAVLMEGSYISSLPLLRRIHDQEVPYKTSQALVTYELLEKKLTDSDVYSSLAEVRKVDLQEEYRIYLALRNLLHIQGKVPEKVGIYEGEPCTMCSTEEEDTHDLESSVKEDTITVLSLELFESLSRSYPWATNAKFVYSPQDVLVSCYLWRDGVRHVALCSSTMEEHPPAMLLYEVVQRIVGDDIKTCTKATTAYNEIVRLLGAQPNEGSQAPSSTPEVQLRDAQQLYDILLHDLGLYPYVQVFRNDAKKAVTVIIKRGSKTFVGVAKTHVLDVYTPDVGKAVALYKAFQEVLEYDILQGVTELTQEALQCLRKADELYKNITTL